MIDLIERFKNYQNLVIEPQTEIMKQGAHGMCRHLRLMSDSALHEALSNAYDLFKDYWADDGHVTVKEFHRELCKLLEFPSGYNDWLYRMGAAEYVERIVCECFDLAD